MKSYKICPCSQFNSDKFKKDKISLKTNQDQLNGFGHSVTPITQIFKSNLGMVYGDFESYRIEHEYNVNIAGRVYGKEFDHFFRKGEIMGYHSEKQKLLLLSGRKDGVIDFTKYTDQIEDISISTIEIDMATLLEKLGSVKLVWFKFPKGMIRASALMGEHIEMTREFIAAKDEGVISTLSFFLEDSESHQHPIMVTQDGAIVLQNVYPDLSKEIEIVLRVKSELLDGTFIEREIRNKKRNPKLPS